MMVNDGAYLHLEDVVTITKTAIDKYPDGIVEHLGDTLFVSHTSNKWNEPSNLYYVGQISVHMDNDLLKSTNVPNTCKQFKHVFLSTSEFYYHNLEQLLLSRRRWVFYIYPDYMSMAINPECRSASIHSEIL